MKDCWLSDSGEKVAKKRIIVCIKTWISPEIAMDIISNVLIGVALLIILGGWLSWISYLIFKKTSSLIPFLGSIFLVLGVYLHPDKMFWDQFKPWVLLSFIFDLGSLPMLVMRFIANKK